MSSTPERPSGSAGSAVGRRSFDGPPRIALGEAGRGGWLAGAVEAGGGMVVDLGEAEAVVWASPTGPEALRTSLDAAPAVHWVQLPWAGIEPFVKVLDHDHLWTCGKGVYAEPVAEQALMLAVSGMRGLGTYARANTWSPPQGVNLLGANVVVLGGGGITESLLRLLGPFGCEVTVLRRTATPMTGATRVGTLDDLDEAVVDADLVVLALALTPETTGLIDARRLGLMKPTAWIVNVARGAHIVTDDLVEALGSGAIGGAGLDVTDPEPLPDGHPLWTLENCLITPHVANTPDMAVPLLSARVTDNVGRFAAGEPLIGLVDVDAGY
ncbi:MAG TPA: D-isomer specific 2-hydroxyacid dehydrogenase family protein [Microthrixaceae bacterium]|nr:D-isomer specific 2-hydroxyacid dehydrogenase family protein [Microthrixaceae bacterium]